MSIQKYLHMHQQFCDVLPHGLDVHSDYEVLRISGSGGHVLNGQRCSPVAPLNQVPHYGNGVQNTLRIRIVQ